MLCIKNQFMLSNISKKSNRNMMYKNVPDGYTFCDKNNGYKEHFFNTHSYT